MTSRAISEPAIQSLSSEPDLAPSYDVVVIGGGAAGLSGAMALGRARRSVLVVDGGEPRNAPAGHIHNYLGSEGMPPAEFLAKGRAEVAQYGVRVVGAMVTAARHLVVDSTAQGSSTPDEDRFEVELSDGRVVRARRLLIATGLRDELPAVPGLAERWGRDVLHCPFCHGWEVRDQAIGILATGPMATHQALLFRQLSADVILFQHTGPAPSDEAAEQLAARGIPVVQGEVASLEVEDDRLSGVRLASGRTIPRQAVVVAPTFVARSGIVTSLGLATIDMEVGGHVVGSYVPSEPRGATSLPGVWLVGNVTNLMAQVISSAADGLAAGAAIVADLINDDIARAVARYRTQPLVADEPFSATMEADTNERVLAGRQHGV